MVLGQELITNYNFEDGLTGWAEADEFTVTNNMLNCISTDGNIQRVFQYAFPSTGTADYHYEIDVFEVNSGSITMNIRGVTLVFNSPGVQSGTITPLADGEVIEIKRTSGITDVKVNYLSVKEILPTTTVEVEWIDSISAAATGNKIYRDTVPSTVEVEIADIANGVQFYSDATAEAATQYKYEVQAHDGAGDETTQEVEGENMDYITTA